MAKKKLETKPREATKRQLSHAKKQQRRQRIYLFGGIAVVVAVIVLTMAGWLFGEFLPMNKAIVTIFDAKISEQQLVDTMTIYGQMQDDFDLEQNMDYILNAMVQNELIRQYASGLGFTVTDEEINDVIGDSEVSDAYREIVRGSLLTQKLKTEYFDKQVPDSGNQVLMNAMLVESEEVVAEVRARLLSGDNFTALAEEFALNTVSKNCNGVFDWHPQSILEDDLDTTIPTGWAFSDNVSKGDVSEAITDNVSSKLLGYWLLRINEEPVTADNETSANVSALLLPSRAEALRVKAKLEAGDNLSMLADSLSQYSPTQYSHGTITAIQSDNISTPFNEYVFEGNAALGVWSEPIQDTRYWTKSGAWIVQIVDKSGDYPYSEEDKSTLVDEAYSEWVDQLWLETTTDITYDFDEEERQLAIERTNRKLNLS